MKKMLVVLLGICLLACACSGDNEVLAAFRNGDIRRGEFMQWLKDRGLAAETAMRNREMLVSEIQLLAINKIALLEAQKGNYAESDRFKFLFADIARRYLNSFLMEKIIRERGFSEKAVRVRQILLPIRQKDQPGAVMEKALKIIAGLDGGANFVEMVRKHSEHPSKNQDGDIGYFVKGQMPSAYAEAAFSLPRGTYTKKPILLSGMNAVCVLFAEDIIEVTPKNVERIFPDEQRRAGILESIRAGIRESCIQELALAGAAVFNEAAVLSANPAEIVFSFGDTTFRVSDLRARIGKMKEIMNETGVIDEAAGRKNLAREFYRDGLLEREARRRGLDRDKDYLKRIDTARTDYLAGDYIEFKSTGDLRISPAEVRREYDRVAAAHAPTGKKIAPFGEVKDQVENDLRIRKRLEGRERWMKQILREYDVNISAELTGKSA